MANSADNNAASMGRSGESKAADAAATEICLHAYASVVKDAIEEIYELASDGRGDFDVRFSIEGMDVFNVDSIAAALGNIKAAMDLGIESATLTRELATKAADLLLPDASQPVKDAIRREIAAGPKTKAPPPVPPKARPKDPPSAPLG